MPAPSFSWSSTRTVTGKKSNFDNSIKGTLINCELLRDERCASEMTIHLTLYHSLARSIISLSLSRSSFLPANQSALTQPWWQPRRTKTAPTRASSWTTVNLEKAHTLTTAAKSKPLPKTCGDGPSLPWQQWVLGTPGGGSTERSTGTALTSSLMAPSTLEAGSSTCATGKAL